MKPVPALIGAHVEPNKRILIEAWAEKDDDRKALAELTRSLQAGTKHLVEMVTTGIQPETFKGERTVVMAEFRPHSFDKKYWVFHVFFEP
jgi:hypothetical protein